MMQGHDLIALASVLYRSLVGGLDPQILALAVLAGRSAVGLCPDLDTAASLHPYYLKPGYAYNGRCVGHRYSLH